MVEDKRLSNKVVNYYIVKDLRPKPTVAMQLTSSTLLIWKQISGRLKLEGDVTTRQPLLFDLIVNNFPLKVAPLGPRPFCFVKQDMNLRSLIIFLFAGGLVSCVSAGGDPPQAGGGPNMAGDPSVQELSCADFFESDTAVGRLSNNVWNKQAAGKSASRQCIMTRGPAPTHQYGWSWSWPLRSNTVFAYPETVIGWKPWSGGPSTHPRLPIRVAAINSFKWTYDLETAATGKYNLATSLWVTRTGVTSVAPNPADISTELMIWTDGYEFAPGGAKQAESMIGGIVFEIWYAANWRDASNTNSNRWTYVAYRAKTPRLSASLDIKKILDDAVARGLVSPDHFVSNIELGNEVMSGTGQTWIKSLALDVQ